MLLLSRLTAIFLAAKTSNHPISIEHYTSNIPKTSPNDVLDLEFLLAQSLNFHFAVWSASRAAHGIWLDLQVGSDPAFRIIFIFLTPDSIDSSFNST
jgi:cyclin H